MQQHHVVFSQHDVDILARFMYDCIVNFDKEL